VRAAKPEALACYGVARVRSVHVGIHLGNRHVQVELLLRDRTRQEDHKHREGCTNSGKSATSLHSTIVLHSTKSATSLQCTITCLETVQLDFFSEFLACVFKVGERHLHRPEFYAPLDVVRVVGRSGRQLEANCSPVG
jgi:hypothetical protein